MKKKFIYLIILMVFLIIILTTVLWNSETLPEPTEIYGIVSLKGELFCPCFLVDGVEVWYDLMEGKPAVDVSNINNSDFVVVKGEYVDGQFWATEIFKEGLGVCSEEDREVDACIEIYQPVCGRPINQTFSNSCFACLNTTVIYYTEGECS